MANPTSPVVASASERCRNEGIDGIDNGLAPAQAARYETLQRATVANQSWSRFSSLEDSSESYVKSRCSPDIMQLRSNMKPLSPVNNHHCRSAIAAAESKIKKQNDRRPPAPKSKGRPVRRSNRLHTKMVVQQGFGPVQVKELEDPVKRLANTADFSMNGDERCQELFLACLGLRRTKPLNVECVSSSTDHKYRFRPKFGHEAVQVTSRLTGEELVQLKEHITEDFSSCWQPLWATISQALTMDAATKASLSSSKSSFLASQVEEISFEELLSGGYMVYPHDIVSEGESSIS